MVEASDHGYVLHTRRVHVTRYNVVRVGYIYIFFFFRTSNCVQQRKTYTRKAATVHLNCSRTVPCNTLCERIAAAVPCNTLCARIAAAV
jgi:hypothetical protein